MLEWEGEGFGNEAVPIGLEWEGEGFGNEAVPV